MNRRLLTLTIMVSMATLVYGCQHVGDCPCGEVCVQGNHRCDVSDTGCTCMQGCTVFDLFVPASEALRVYGNRCQCGETSGRSACTRAMWRGEPIGMVPYEENPNCNVAA